MKFETIEINDEFHRDLVCVSGNCVTAAVRPPRVPQFGRAVQRAADDGVTTVVVVASGQLRRVSGQSSDAPVVA